MSFVGRQRIPYRGCVSEIVPTTGTNGTVASAADTLADLQRFETVVRNQLDAVGLPSDQVFVSVDQRAVMLSNMGSVLSTLQADILARSHYISKMIAASAVGLFDAALNYLWDELVSELRRRVIGFDLGYFYDTAAGGSDLRKNLKSEDDLHRIDDASMLRASHEIGMLTDVGYQRLDHIRYMRNHASAAHPNQVTLTGLDLANWLQICINEVINTPPDTVTATIGKLLANVKKDRLDQSAIDQAAVFFDQLPADRADTLASGFFGLYTAPDRTVIVADNIRTLWPKLWPFIREETRSSYGLRHARASANAETDYATAARELIELVNGTAYLTPEIRAVEMDTALEVLVSTHRGMNNFYNEGTPARRVSELAGPQGDVPSAIRDRYVRTITELYIGNGYGVSWNAEPTYLDMIQRFSSSDAGVALRMFNDVAFSSILASSTGKKQWGLLLDALDPKLTSTTDRNLMAVIRAFTGTPDQLRIDTAIKKLLAPPAA